MDNIYLVGMPGSGKTTLGKKLANTLDYEFVDLDFLIQQNEGMSIEQIFEEKGEDFFREIERMYLQSTNKLKKTIISTGGGTPCFFDNMEWINQHGLSIFLNISLEQLMQRILQNPTKRPLLKGLSESEVYEKLLNLMEIRNPYYLKSKLIVDINGLNKNTYTTSNQHDRLNNILFGLSVDFWLIIF